MLLCDVISHFAVSENFFCSFIKSVKTVHFKIQNCSAVTVTPLSIIHYPVAAIQTW
jgi:hypothetical protein